MEQTETTRRFIVSCFEIRKGFGTIQELQKNLKNCIFKNAENNKMENQWAYSN